MSHASPARQTILKVGLICIYAALVLNPWLVLSARKASSSAWWSVLFLDVALVVVGLVLFRFRSAPALQAFIERQAALPFLTFVLFLALTCEALACLVFWKVVPAEARRRAFVTALGEVPGSGTKAIGKIRPYLWSNYAPNPESPEANAHGWRYGGGPKTNALRILCLGGSTTWGDTATDAAHSYPAQLEKYLRVEGFSVDVINGGAPYYTSAELVGTLAFRGIYTKPDLVLIHTGGNDIEPFLSPRDYNADYSHWRSAQWLETAGAGGDGVFAFFWRIPSWTLRVVSLAYFKPTGRLRLMVGNQKSQWIDSVLATNDVSGREPIGLDRNFRSLIATARAHGAEPVAILFNLQTNRLHDKISVLQKDPSRYAAARERTSFALDKSNSAMERAAKELNVRVIAFNRFQPTQQKFWVDHCHLTDEGEAEKAAFIGDALIGFGLLQQTKSQGSSPAVSGL